MINYPYLCLRIQINHRLYGIRIWGCTLLRCRCTVVHGAFIYKHDFSLFYFCDFTFHINSVTPVHLNALLMHHALTCCNALVQPSFHLCFIWILEWLWCLSKIVKNERAVNVVIISINTLYVFIDVVYSIYYVRDPSSTIFKIFNWQFCYSKVIKPYNIKILKFSLFSPTMA